MHRHLRDTIDLLWFGQAGRFKNSRCDIRAMSELTAHTAFVFNAFWPRDHHRVTNAAESRGHLLSPLKRRVASPRPCRCVMRIHVRAAPFFEAAVSFDGFQLLVGRERDAVERGHFVERPGLRSLHARAVVAEDVNDQRVISESHVVDRFHHAADSVVRVFLVAGINLHLVRINFLYVRRDAVPRRKRRVTRRQFRVRGNHPELLLTCECFFAQLVPALIEFAFVFVAPFLWHLMWRVSRAG